MGKCAATRDLVSDSGPETPVPALFLSRGCLAYLKNFAPLRSLREATLLFR